MEPIRNNWTTNEIEEIYNQPVLDLVFRAASIHRSFNNPREIQISSLLSVKTGGCSEDCKYCSQSSYYETPTEKEEKLELPQIIEKAKAAREAGASRFCLSTAWREVPEAEMGSIIEMISGVRDLGLEVCATMGMIKKEQAKRLKEAGLHTYNHNLDTGADFYKEIISTRSYDDRLNTLSNLFEAGLDICSGGIIGMGESAKDRIDMLTTLSNLPKHPGSVPINILVPIDGTPMDTDPDFNFWDLLRTIATTRIIMPRTNVRLSAGRNQLTEIEQGFCIFAGANSIFSGEKLLTTDNAERSADENLFRSLDLFSRQAQPVDN